MRTITFCAARADAMPSATPGEADRLAHQVCPFLPALLLTYRITYRKELPSYIRAERVHDKQLTPTDHSIPSTPIRPLRPLPTDRPIPAHSARPTRPPRRSDTGHRILLPFFQSSAGELARARAG